MRSVTEQFLKEIVDTVVKRIHPERIYLFGSQAGGEITADSDLDLLIIEREDFGPHRSRWKELQHIRKTLSSFRIAKDILLYSSSEFDQYRQSPNHIIAHCLRDEGRPLYERP